MILPAELPLATERPVYIDFLKDLPLSTELDYKCFLQPPPLGCVRGVSYLFPGPTLPPDDYMNIWAAVWPMVGQSLQLGCTMEWEAGNWLTMGVPDTYLARLNGTVIDAPTGTVLTFGFPPGSPQLQRTFVVPPANPSNPTALGLPVDISEPFVIPFEPATVTLDILVPEEFSALREGSVVRFLGEAVAEPNSPGFDPGQFIVGHAGTCVVDNAPPQVGQITTIQNEDGSLDVRVSATDEITAPLAALLRFRVDGGLEEQVVMDFEEIPVVGDLVLFRQIIGPFPGASTVELTAEVFDNVANSAFSPSLVVVLLITVQIDIKPGSDPNCINLGSEGFIPVAVLTTATFDAANADQSSLTLEGAVAREKGKSGNIGSFEDVDGDGDLDLVVQFPTADLDLTEADTEAILDGLTTAGTPIRGSDSICVVP